MIPLENVLIWKLLVSLTLTRGFNKPQDKRKCKNTYERKIKDIEKLFIMYELFNVAKMSRRTVGRKNLAM